MSDKLDKRVYQKDNGDWYCRYQIQGQQKHRKCYGAKNRREAELMRNSFLEKLQKQINGVLPSEEEEKGATMNKAFDDYLEHAESKKSYKQIKSRVRILREYFQKKKLYYIKKVKPNDIIKLKTYLHDSGLCKSTVNRYLEILKTVFNMAIDNDYLDKNPIKKHSMYIIENQVVRSLSIVEEKRLLEVLSQPRYEYLKGIVTVAINTGLRRQNILDLTWTQIHLTDRVIEITKNKSNKHILKPINDTLMEYFESTPKERRTGYVFINPLTGQKCKEIKRAWRTVREKADIKNFRFHDLRHTVGTRLAQQNVPVPVIQQVLDHSDIKTTMRYVHTANEQILSAMNKLNSYNEDLIQNDKLSQD